MGVLKAFAPGLEGAHRKTLKLATESAQFLLNLPKYLQGLIFVLRAFSCDSQAFLDRVSTSPALPRRPLEEGELPQGICHAEELGDSSGSGDSSPSESASVLCPSGLATNDRLLWHERNSPAGGEGAKQVSTRDGQDFDTGAFLRAARLLFRWAEGAGSF